MFHPHVNTALLVQSTLTKSSSLKLRRTGLTWTQTSSVNHLKKDRPDTHSIMSPQSAPLTATHSVTGRALAAESPPSSTTSTIRIGTVELSLVSLCSPSLPLFSDFSAVFPTLPEFSFSKLQACFSPSFLQFPFLPLSLPRDNSQSCRPLHLYSLALRQQ